MNPDIIYEEDEWPSKEERVLGALCYAPFGFILPSVMKKDSEFIAFHAKRWGIIFGIYFAIIILSFFWIFWLMSVVYLWLAGFAGWKAYCGKKFSYGFIDAIVEKL